MPEWSFLVIVGIILIFIGFFLAAAGMLLPIRKGVEKPEGRKEVKGGGVILIGPIPVVFGTDKKYALILIVLTIALMLLAIIFLGYINK